MQTSEVQHMKPVWIWRSQPQGSVEVDAHIITPIVHSAGFYWPSAKGFGGWLWQFPQAVEVEERASGTLTRLPVPDPTRTIVWLLVAMALVALTVMASVRWRRSRRTMQQRTMQERTSR
jgi:hypothetical protein